MIKNRPFLLFVIFTILLVACAGPAGAPVEQSNVVQPVVDAGQAAPIAASSPIASPAIDVAQSGADHHSDVDLTHLTVGDGK